MSVFLKQGGGYRNLRVFQITEIICDLTVIFIRRFIPPKSRTCDQMEQAARSGKQNIAEGSMASTTSRKTELKLTNVAKASLEELLLDYEDYLRQHHLEKWDKEHPRVQRLKAYLRSEQFMTQPDKYAESMSAEEYCNLQITLINQATYMLRKLLEAQQKQFLEQGGITEQLYNARKGYRQANQSQTNQSQTSQTGQTRPTSPTSPTGLTKK